nr:MAG TPA: hypothetical protein [Caudoviricetes sp.]
MNNLFILLIRGILDHDMPLHIVIKFGYFYFNSKDEFNI